MKKITILIALVFSSSLMFSQIVLNEDFESGATLPTGWTNDDIAAAGDAWIIETTGEAALAGAGNTLVYTNGGAVGNYASFNSDATSNNNLAEEVALVSPTFDASALTQLTLSYNHLFAGNFGGNAFVEVSTDGASWTQVASYSGDGYQGGAISLDVSAELAGKASAQVRFRWTGNFSVAWYVDNVSVFECTVVAPDPVSAIAPANGAIDVPINYGTTTNNIGPFEWMPAATGDPADSYNVSLGITATGDDIGTIPGFPIGNSINYTWQPNTTYFWFVEAVNCSGVTPSAVFSFTTEACTETAAPAIVTAPTPADAAVDIVIDANDGNSLVFSWTGDPDADFTLNLGTADPPTQAFNNFDNGGTISGLVENTTYFWSVDAVNCFGNTTGTVWSFTTGAALSVEENNLNTFIAYPNPTSDILNIKSSVEIDEISVFNLLGQKVAIFEKNEIIDSSINISELKSGLYLVRISAGDNTETIRVTKK